MTNPKWRHTMTAALLTGAVALGGFAVPAGAATMAPTATTLARTAALQAAAVVPGSSDPIAVAGAAAVQAQLDLRDIGYDDGTAAATRRQLAEIVAAKAKLDVEALDAVWAGTDPTRLIALFAAFGQVGVPYRTFQSKPGIGFDCSGLTTYAWGAAGKALPRSSGSQIAALPATTLDAALPGDILWYPGHVGLSLGLGKVYLHSPYPGRNVELAPIRRVSRVGSPVV